MAAGLWIDDVGKSDARLESPIHSLSLSTYLGRTAIIIASSYFCGGGPERLLISLLEGQKDCSGPGF